MARTKKRERDWHGRFKSKTRKDGFDYYPIMPALSWDEVQKMNTRCLLTSVFNPTRSLAYRLAEDKVKSIKALAYILILLSTIVVGVAFALAIVGIQFFQGFIVSALFHTIALYGLYAANKSYGAWSELMRAEE